MTKLISTYARSTGLQIDPKGPNVKEVFYPTCYERYITIQSGSSNQAAKNYDYWPEVLRLIGPMLAANKIAILHLGGKEDPQLTGTVDLRGKTSVLQSNYLIGKTLLHVGGDSWLAHCAGSFRLLLYLHRIPQRLRVARLALRLTHHSVSFSSMARIAQTSNPKAMKP